jgi:cysteine desulfurase / selenocysteine lyase
LLSLKPRLVSFMHMSNVLGTINPAKEMIRLAHNIGAITLLDGAQSVPHFPVDIIDLDADFLAFSAHKMCGPTGIGVLYGKKEILTEMPPFLGGGDMIKRVSLRDFSTNSIPYKFEAGTPAIAEAVGFGAAVGYLQSIGMEKIAEYEHIITSYATERLEEIPGIKIFGSDPGKKGGVISFTLVDIHPHDISQVLDRYGIAVRAGHHCAMPLHEKFGISATARASFYFYNTMDEVDQLANSLYHVRELFGM